MTITISKTESAFVKYIEGKLPPVSGDYVCYNNTLKRVIAVAPEKNLIIVERFRYKLGVYQEIPYKNMLGMKPFALDSKGNILGRIPDKDNNNLRNCQSITGNIKTKLIPLLKGTRVNIIRVSPDSPLIWTKTKLGTIEFVKHPLYIVQMCNGQLLKFHRNQLQPVDDTDDEKFFINVELS